MGIDANGISRHTEAMKLRGVSVRFPGPLYAYLRQLATAQGISLNELVRRACDEVYSASVDRKAAPRTGRIER